MLGSTPIIPIKVKPNAMNPNTMATIAVKYPAAKSSIAAITVATHTVQNDLTNIFCFSLGRISAHTQERAAFENSYRKAHTTGNTNISEPNDGLGARIYAMGPLEVRDFS